MLFVGPLLVLVLFCVSDIVVMVTVFVVVRSGCMLKAPFALCVV